MYQDGTRTTTSSSRPRDAMRDFAIVLSVEQALRVIHHPLPKPDRSSIADTHGISRIAYSDSDNLPLTPR